MRCLFVGGTNDGTLIELENKFPFYRLPTRRSMKSLPPHSELAVTFSFETFTPHDWSVGDGGKVITIYALEGMTARMVMERLVRQYRGKEDE